MNCPSVKAWMRERFDQGLALEEGFESHLEACDGCRAYVARLRAVDAGLASLTGEASSPGFESKLVARLKADRNAPSRAWAVGLAALTVLAFVVLGWQLPIVSYLDEWFTQLAAWQPDILVAGSLFTPFVEWGREAWSSIEPPGFVASVQSPWISGGSIAALAVVLVGFNALLRRFIGEPQSGSFRRAR